MVHVQEILDMGGWGVVILEDTQKPILLNGGENNTTNNRMEFTAAIKSIKYFQDKQNITIYTDSQYLKNGIETWINNWKKMDGKHQTKKIKK